jgi:hypothetical protein
VLDDGETAPHALPVQLVPESVQFTPLFAVSFCKLAENIFEELIGTFAVVGLTATEIAVAPDVAASVIVAVPIFVESAIDVAVSVTVGGFGTAAGAVYITGAPEAVVMLESVPHAAAVQPAPESVQAVPLFCGSSSTVAVKLWP